MVFVEIWFQESTKKDLTSNVFFFVSAAIVLCDITLWAAVWGLNPGKAIEFFFYSAILVLISYNASFF